MQYDKLSTNSLKDFHDAIKKCLDDDDATPQGQMKPYGVREFSDWGEHLLKIETELKARNELFSALNISSPSNAPIPIEAILYERIKACLLHEDNLPNGSIKPYGVRVHSDWKQQADLFEKTLDSVNHTYNKIAW